MTNCPFVDPFEYLLATLQFCIIHIIYHLLPQAGKSLRQMLLKAKLYTSYLIVKHATWSKIKRPFQFLISCQLYCKFKLPSKAACVLGPKVKVLPRGPTLCIIANSAIGKLRAQNLRSRSRISQLMWRICRTTSAIGFHIPFFFGRI